MKLQKRLFLFFLALVMALGTLTGCRIIYESEETIAPQETTSPNLVFTDPYWGPKPLAGEEIVICSFVRAVDANSFEAEQDGTVINNAVYERNKKLSDWLGCAIRVEEMVGSTSSGSEYDGLYELGDACEYNIVAAPTYKLIRLAVNGFFHDLVNQSNINLDADYYDDGYNYALKAGGRQYLVTGKFSLSWYRYQVVTFFNRNMFEEKKLGNPYDLVLNQEWTIAKMAELASNFYEDLDGMGDKDECDRYGYYLFVGPLSSQTDGFMSAWNLSVLTKDKNGYFMARELDSAPWITATQAFLDMFYLDGCYKAETFEAGDGNTAVANKFYKQEAAMITYRMYAVESDEFVQLSDDRDGFGILPLPKANEGQKDYISFVQDFTLIFGIPKAMRGKDLENSTAFLEAFAWVSYSTTVPAYYEKALTKKYVNDENARAVMKIIDSNVVVDPVNVYYSSYFKFTTGSLRPVYAGTKDMTSIITAQILDEGLQVSIDNLNTMLRDLDQKLTAEGYPNSGVIIK